MSEFEFEFLSKFEFELEVAFEFEFELEYEFECGTVVKPCLRESRAWRIKHDFRKTRTLFWILRCAQSAPPFRILRCVLSARLLSVLRSAQSAPPFRVLRCALSARHRRNSNAQVSE